MATNTTKEIWVFGDYRNYFENRVTLQLIAKGSELAEKTGGKLAVVVFGHEIDEWIWEYQCHGAEKVYVIDNQELSSYKIETFSSLLESLCVKFEPEILLIGGTSFGRELAPRVAKRLSTGLTADCIDLNINDDGLMVMTAPSFGGHLLADIITPEKRPQMATVRPGTFKELSHNDDLKGEIINIELPGHLHNERIRLVSSTKLEPKGQSLEKADVVIIGGRGMGSSDKFDKLKKLAGLLDAEVGATRPAVFSGWIEHDRLIGQAGRSVSPKVLFTFGTSGAVQHTAAINDAEFVIAVNKNPDATMMKMADAAIIADTDKFLPALIKELEDRLAEKNAK